MSQASTDHSKLKSCEPAARWIELAERVSICSRLFRDGLAGHIGRDRLSGPELSILWLCREAPDEGFGQTDLAAALGVSAAQVSGVVEQLRRAGLLEGRRAETDRRRQLWRLTPAGRDALQTVLADLSDWAARLDGRLEQSDSRRLAALLAEVAEALRDRPDDHPAERPIPATFIPEAAPPDVLRRDESRRGAA